MTGCMWTMRLPWLPAAVAMAAAGPDERRVTFAEAAAGSWARSPDRLVLEGQGGAAAARGRAAHALFTNAQTQACVAGKGGGPAR